MVAIKSFKKTSGLSSSPMKLPSALSTEGIAVLKRTCLRVQGADAHKFLNGLTTNNLNDIKERSAQYTAFLNPQGRMMYDAFIWRMGEAEFLVEADDRIGQDLVYHLKQFQLRSKLQVEDVSSKYHVNVYWNRESKLASDFSVEDPRGDLMMQRELLESDEDPKNQSIYKTLRFAFGIPEGPREIPRVQAIPLEYNIDLLGGICFTKGCYIGQELVARTHHRGTIRKRIMPVLLGDSTKSFDDSQDYSAAVEADVVPQGGNEKDRMARIISTHGNLGMALVRLELWNPGVKYAIPKLPGLLVEPYTPPWWSRHGLLPSKSSKLQ